MCFEKLKWLSKVIGIISSSIRFFQSIGIQTIGRFPCFKRSELQRWANTSIITFWQWTFYNIFSTFAVAFPFLLSVNTSIPTSSDLLLVFSLHCLSSRYRKQRKMRTSPYRISKIRNQSVKLAIWFWNFVYKNIAARVRLRIAIFEYLPRFLLYFITLITFFFKASALCL